MFKLYVIGFLMLAFSSAHVWAADQEEAQATPEISQSDDARNPAEVKAEMDELEHVLQSAYDYNDRMIELGDAQPD